MLSTDAGTPAISDPGFLLIRVRKKQYEIDCLPGATAFFFLVNSALWRVVFEGFLPLKKGRQTRLKILAEENVQWFFMNHPIELLALQQFAEFMGRKDP